MDRVFASNVSASPPTATGGVVGYPQDGNPSTSTPPTTPGARWFAMITESLLGLLDAASLAHNGADWTLVRQAVQALANAAAAAAQAAAISTAAADATTKANAARSGAVSDVLALYSGGSLWFKLPNGWIVQMGTYVAATTDTAYTVSLPTSFPNAHKLAIASVNTSGSVTGSWSAYAVPGSLSTVVLTGDVQSGSASNVPIAYLCIGN